MCVHHFLTMNAPSLPVSALIKSTDEPGSSDKRQSREEWRKQKELEEARKAGTAPAAVDEEGRDINPHIPQYISSAPWYIDAKGPTLKHQRARSSQETLPSLVNARYDRGLTNRVATKYRKGACENCGAMTHKRKDCLERPRKIGAKYSNESIAPDEKLVSDLPLDYDGKRDRWAGFDPSAYKAVVEEYEQVEEAKRKLKEAKGDEAADSSEDEDADKYADHIDMPGTKVDSKQRITVRNLRIREDTAKYLRNLDPDSAFYDPKTRSMRDDPYKNSTKRPDEFAGENFIRYTGDTLEAYDAQKFAWNASEKGVDVHLNAEPTRAEMVHKQFKEKSTEIKESVKNSILDKYGNEASELPPEMIAQQSEFYVEYSRSGKPIKGIVKPTVKSIYEEDVFINNHKSVWGSYWKDFCWGYKCCHSFIKNSYCTGDIGKSSSSGGSTSTLTSREIASTSGSASDSVTKEAQRTSKSKGNTYTSKESSEPDAKKVKTSKPYVDEAELEKFNLQKARDGDPLA